MFALSEGEMLKCQAIRIDLSASAVHLNLKRQSYSVQHSNRQSLGPHNRIPQPTDRGTTSHDPPYPPDDMIHAGARKLTATCNSKDSSPGTWTRKKRWIWQSERKGHTHMGPTCQLGSGTYRNPTAAEWGSEPQDLSQRGPQALTRNEQQQRHRRAVLLRHHASDNSDDASTLVLTFRAARHRAHLPRMPRGSKFSPHYILALQGEHLEQSSHLMLARRGFLRRQL
ncbi:hypothetical protein R3P38DRAFT_3364712 [Favolaschia claudopus]|uniref:Uncharacterized protein n=1 Tax=Favolaschia claudopus TaxID=2862362 RepID=A0AAW0AHE4_9AGAR